ncbi:hypothetical protein Tco_0589273 [Tanacetum coccineum]
MIGGEPSGRCIGNDCGTKTLQRNSHQSSILDQMSAQIGEENFHCGALFLPNIMFLLILITLERVLILKENYDFVANINKSFEPNSYEKTTLDKNWISAMNDEMHALCENNTWFLPDLPH